MVILICRKHRTEYLNKKLMMFSGKKNWKNKKRKGNFKGGGDISENWTKNHGAGNSGGMKQSFWPKLVSGIKGCLK